LIKIKFLLQALFEWYKLKSKDNLFNPIIYKKKVKKKTLQIDPLSPWPQLCIESTNEGNPIHFHPLPFFSLP